MKYIDKGKQETSEFLLKTLKEKTKGGITKEIIAEYAEKIIYNLKYSNSK